MIPDHASGQPQKVQLNGDGTPFVPQPPIPVNSWDNHEQHIMWHNNFRKTQQFELLDPIVKKAFELHVQMHMIAMQATMLTPQGYAVNQGVGAQPPMGNPGGPVEESPPPSQGAPQG